jgi:hypothetical protein
MERRQNRDGDENDKLTNHSDTSSPKSSGSDAGRSSHKGLSPWHYSYKRGEASSSNDVGKSKRAIETTSDLKVKHENNALPQKIEDIVIEHFNPRPRMFRDCRVASVRDFEALADELHDALQPEKSPESVYRVLYFLLREDKAVEKLNNVFQKKDGTNLETALTAHFSEGTPELKYALELLGKEDTSAERKDDRSLETVLTECYGEGTPELKYAGGLFEEEDANYIALSKRVYESLLQRDFMTVYRALTPFQRNTASLCDFNNCYKKYKQCLLKIDTLDVENYINQIRNISSPQADMIQHLTGDSLKFGQFLIGDSALETKVVSLSEAERLAKVALEQTFENRGGKRLPLPHENPKAICAYRAHAIAEAFKELGYGVEKIVAHYHYINERGTLEHGLVNPDNPKDYWRYHTACCIQVQTDSGTEERIIDPSGRSKQLWTREEWIKRMGQDPSSCEFITFKDWQEKLEKQYEQKAESPYPIGSAYVFTTSRNCIGESSLSQIEGANFWKDIPDQYSWIRYKISGRTSMEDCILFSY